MREGMFNALAVIQEGMEETARTVIQNVLEDHNRRGLTGAVGGILRQVPSNMVRPVILATTARVSSLMVDLMRQISSTCSTRSSRGKSTSLLPLSFSLHHAPCFKYSSMCLRHAVAIILNFAPAKMSCIA